MIDPLFDFFFKESWMLETNKKSNFHYKLSIGYRKGTGKQI